MIYDWRFSDIIICDAVKASDDLKELKLSTYWAIVWGEKIGHLKMDLNREILDFLNNLIELLDYSEDKKGIIKDIDFIIAFVEFYEKRGTFDELRDDGDFLGALKNTIKKYMEIWENVQSRDI